MAIDGTAIPVISHVFGLIMIPKMSGQLRKDMGRLNAFCEGEVARG